MRDQAQLICYVDRFAGGFGPLADLLEGPLAGAFGGVHLLPFFDPIDGADAGFDPADHRVVDPRLGTWDDVRRVGEVVPVMADLIVNHVSSSSPQFQDWLAHGGASAYDGMFLTLDAVFPDGVDEAGLTAIYRPRPWVPLTTVQHADRRKRLVWTTFTSEQIDLDVRSPQATAYLDGILDTFAANGIRMVRLDAVGYAVKTPGTSSFMTPETFAFIEELSGRAHARGLEILVEVHSYWQRQVEIAARVDHVYDFALPPLVLHALYTGTSDRLERWCAIRPRNAVTVLDTHDGIGVIDVGPDQSDIAHLGLLDEDEIDELVAGIHEHSQGASQLATGTAASNLDVYQVNCTFYDALGGDEDPYLLARLIQVFLPGVPQIYYVGLLAGHNDVALLQRTGVGRDINRHHYTAEERSAALERPVVRRLLALLRFRNTHPAFGGEWSLLDSAAGELRMRWEAGDDAVELRADLVAGRGEVVVSSAAGVTHVTDLLELPGMD
ncbi:sucrose phosphorylase [Nitriliruptoraceae bacterium ZYF776]|nr:sucrose phosphorylase [Profundirhabdus halotolerans]